VKISWGVGITITIVVFMLVSLWLIYFSFNQEVNLVRDDYYEAEVQFNEKMETINRTNLLTERINISLVPQNIQVVFPESFSHDKIKGSIFLYRPSDRDLDLKLPIELDSSKVQLISTENMLNGLWKIKIEWNVDTNIYFNDKLIMVQ
jgi:nitrogen fixation protein FixH